MTTFDSVTRFRENSNVPTEDFSSNRGTVIFGEIQKYVTPVKSKDKGKLSVERNYGSMGLSNYLSVGNQFEFDFLCKLYDAWFNKKQRLVLAQIPTLKQFNFFCDLDFTVAAKFYDNDPDSFIKFIEKTVFLISRVVYKFFAHNKFENNDSSLPSSIRKPAECDEKFLNISDEANRAKSVDFMLSLNEWTGAGIGYHRYSMFALSVSPKRGVLNGLEVVKPGLHVYSVGNLRVTLEEAQLISHAIIEELFTEFGPYEEVSHIPTFGWKEVVDLAVLRGGLRMMGSARGVDACPQCSTKDELTQFASSVLNRIQEEEKFKTSTFSKSGMELKVSQKNFKHKTCYTCNGERHILSDRTYEPWFVANRGELDQELTDLFLTNKFQAFLATNIRTRFFDGSEFQCPEQYKTLALRVQTFINHEGPLEQTKEQKKLDLSQCIETSKEASKGQFYPPNSKESYQVCQIIRSWTFDTDNDGISQKPWQHIAGGILKRFQKFYALNLVDASQGSTIYQTNRICLRCCPPGSSIRGSTHKRPCWFKITPTHIIQKSFASNNPECQLDEEQELQFVTKPLDPAIASLLFPSLLSSASSKKGANHQLAAQQIKSFAPPKVFTTSIQTRLAEEAKKDDQFLPRLAKVVAVTQKIVQDSVPGNGPSRPSTPQTQGVLSIEGPSGKDLLQVPSFDELKEKARNKPVRLEIPPDEFQSYVQMQEDDHDVTPSVEEILKKAPYKPTQVAKNDPLQKLFSPRMTVAARREFEAVSRGFLLRLRDTGDPLYRDILHRQIEGFDGKALDHSLSTVDDRKEPTSKKQKFSKTAEDLKKFARNSQ